MDQERRQKRKEIRHLQSESVWLQKALFALRKAESAREKLADARDEEAEPYALGTGDRPITLEALEDGLERRIDETIQAARERRRSLY